MRLDSDAFRELWLVLIARVRKKYSRWCLRLYWSYGMISDWAEDIAQDGLLAAQAEIDKYNPDRGIQQAERGETVPHKEIENMIDEWLNE